MNPQQAAAKTRFDAVVTQAAESAAVSARRLREAAPTFTYRDLRTDTPSVWAWTLNDVDAEGAITGSVFRVLSEDNWVPTGGGKIGFKIRPDGRIERGTPWIRRKGIGLDDASGSTDPLKLYRVSNDWPKEFPRAVIMFLDPVPVAAMEDLSRRAQQFFGLQTEIVFDNKLAQHYRATVALRAKEA